MINKRNGFSIIELMTAIIIIAIMALVSFAVFKGFREKTSVKVAARDVTNIMRLARRKAVIERKDYLAVYDLKNEKVWVQSYSSYTTSGISPDFGTEQVLPDRAVIARVTAGSGGLATGPGPPPKPSPDIDDYTAEPSYSVGYHKFSPKSTVTAGRVNLRDEDQKTFYEVTVLGTTARAKIYSKWQSE